MSRPFALPDLGEGLVEAEIVGVLVREGDVIARDAPLLEVETDKARVEIPSPMSGRVETVHVRPGQTVPVGAVLITFADAVPGDSAAPPSGPRTPARTSGTQGTAPATTAARPASATTDGKREERPAPAPGDGATVDRARGAIPVAPTADPGRSERPAAAGAAKHEGPVPATPATRRLARELSVDLAAVAGSGPGGRVTDDDVRRAAARPAGAPPAVAEPAAAAPEPARPLAALEVPPLPRFEQWGPVERSPLSHLRRTIAQRMALSASVIPHVTHFDRADITDLDALIRDNLEAARARGVTLTLTSFLLKAAALALRVHPTFNASLDAGAGELVLKRYYHLGIAVATDRGLIVPVIRSVDAKPVVELARELQSLAQRVREGRASLEDLRGGTFTITNIGALGGTAAIPIINYPEVAILGVARGREEAVVRGGQIVPRLMLPLTLTFDHRVADGADGARFASEIVRLLEHPDQLLLEL